MGNHSSKVNRIDVLDSHLCVSSAITYVFACDSGTIDCHWAREGGDRSSLMEKGAAVDLGEGSKCAGCIWESLPCLRAVSSLVGLEHGKVWAKDRGGGWEAMGGQTIRDSDISLSGLLFFLNVPVRERTEDRNDTVRLLEWKFSLAAVWSLICSRTISW